MAFSEPASWVTKGSLPELMLGGPGGSCKTSCALAPETSKHHFYHILFVKQVTKAGPDARGEEFDYTSRCNVKITCEKACRMWNIIAVIFGHTVCCRGSGLFKVILGRTATFKRIKEMTQDVVFVPLFFTSWARLLRVTNLWFLTLIIKILFMF